MRRRRAPAVALPGSRPSRGARGLLLVVALATMLTSCSGSGRVDGPVLSSPRPPLFGGGGLDAEIKGRVVFDEGSGCLLLEFEGGGRLPVVWPAGAAWRADPPAVELRGQRIEPGMVVDGGGGYLHYEEVREIAGTAVADAAQACAGPTGEVAVFNRGSAVRVVAG